LTGARGGEVCSMRIGDVDRTGAAWCYRPRTHKTMLHGHHREIFIGPKAQAGLGPYLMKVNPDAFVFSPREREETGRQEAHEQRKPPSHHGNNVGTNRVRKPRRTAGDRYTTTAYNKAISRACADAFPPPPHLGPRIVEVSRKEKTIKRPERQSEWMR